jgi:hypothetical protein
MGTAMIKVFFLLKRKSTITHEQFRDHFENVHVKLANGYFTKIMVRYERNYPSEVTIGVQTKRPDTSFEYDCISEWCLPDEAALQKIWDCFAVPEIGKEFHDDEENFLDREATLMVRCDEGNVVNTGV